MIECLWCYKPLEIERKGFGYTLALEPWGWGLRCRWGQSAGAGPCPLEHEAQPYQGNQGQLVEKESGNHGKTPSYKDCNEGIVPGFQTVEISRTLEVHHLKMSEP